ncbi:MAG: 50S ribosomal protein L6 [Acidobacteriota bacterium]|nr:MAG: 50S ribosomal protein L6 [Acidobacteriota bacterium]
MSRIGKQIINVPSGVQVYVEKTRILVEGPKGKLEVPLPAGIGVESGDSTVQLTRVNNLKQLRSLHGLTRALLFNAVTGVSEGFVKKLDVVGIGYRAEVRGRYLNLSLGHSHPTEFPIPEDMEISVEREQRQISNYVATIKIGGHDRYRVGQIAADIRALRPPDAYKGKGVRYADEVVRTKVGKKGA